ncbi:MAG: hypothetical protein COT84_04385 [Chlamydiae bacterium CG10_big_fil_rev_8_21_14_0_10_35_9]|nr:MAG: hypothetical protein COT84_04385 [Chlamydiae bacterium CG10_big_fil_rev_8_21_14_0_10_35_9]
MITIEHYKKALQDLSRIDLNSSHVTFAQKELVVRGIRHRVTVPQIEQKTSKVVRVVQRIFYYVFGKFFTLNSDRINTARNFDCLTSQAIHLFPGQEDFLEDDQLGFDVKNEITQVAFRVLQKVKRACNNAEDTNRIEIYVGVIRRKFFRARQRTLVTRRAELVRLRDAEAEVDRIRAEVTRVDAELTRARAQILNLTRNNMDLWLENVRLTDNAAASEGAEASLNSERESSLIN